jgi:hypothetical protein
MRKIESEIISFSKKKKRDKQFVLIVKYNMFFGQQTSKTKHTTMEGLAKELNWYLKWNNWQTWRIEDIKGNLIDEAFSDQCKKD